MRFKDVSRSVHTRKVTVTTIKQPAKKIRFLCLRSLSNPSFSVMTGDVQPFDPQKLREDGDHSAQATFISEGSAALKPNYFDTAYDGIVSALEQPESGTEVTYSEGTRGLFPLLYCELSDFLNIFSVVYKPLSSLDYDISTPSGELGWIGKWHSHVNDDRLIPHADSSWKRN